MTEIAVRAEGLGKRYYIGAERRKDTLVDTLADATKAPIRRALKLMRGQATGASELDQEIWALRDLSLEVEQGEVLGIIGPNGAGKSTLLKILSRITEPTEGYAEVRGRVGCLLEVGTGFHRELTGRENVYLNGAVLGMSRSEMDEKFDEIVEFAGTARFLDTPIKHYSSGMRVRLAFAVAAHLDPEVLVIDEVLSVGDAAFRKKCLGRMDEVARGGRTVLFVSHNMNDVARLCDRVMLLDHGRVKSRGRPRDIISEYLSSSASPGGIWERPEEMGSGDVVQIDKVAVRSEDESGTGELVGYDTPFAIEIEYTVRSLASRLAILWRLEDENGTRVWDSWDTDTAKWGPKPRQPGRYRSVCNVPAKLLRPTQYTISVGAVDSGIRWLEKIDGVLTFEVSGVGCTDAERTGVVFPMLDWEVSRVEDEQVAAG